MAGNRERRLGSQLLSPIAQHAYAAYSRRSQSPPREFMISRLTPTPQATAVYASCSASLPPHATLASRRPTTVHLRRTCTCPYRKSNPDVLMVQTSEVWGGHDTANGLHSTRAERKPTTN